MGRERRYLNAKVEKGGSIAVEVRKGLDIATASSPIPVMEQYSRKNANLIRNTDAIKIPITFQTRTSSRCEARASASSCIWRR